MNLYICKIIRKIRVPKVIDAALYYPQRKCPRCNKLLQEVLGVDNSLFFYLLYLYQVSIIQYDYCWTLDNYHYDLKIGRYVAYSSHDLKEEPKRVKNLEIVIPFEISIPKDENPFEKHVREMEEKEEEEDRRIFSELDNECNLLESIDPIEEFPFQNQLQNSNLLDTDSVEEFF